MTDPLCFVPATLIGLYVRPPYLRVALPAWGLAILAFTHALATRQQLEMSANTMAAVFIAPIVVGYAVAGVAKLYRRKKQPAKPNRTT